MSLNLPARPLLLWTVRIISFAAMSVCFMLFVMKLNGSISSLRGCGAEGGCSNVMGGRWSEWFHMPVTVWAGMVYVAILLLTTRRIRQVLGRTGDQLLAAGGVVLAGAAIYFLSLMFFGTEGEGRGKVGFCPWCLGLHLAGLTVSAILLTAAVQQQREGERGILEAAMLSGFAAIGILAAGQIWGPRPDTHLLTETELKKDVPGPAQPATMKSAANRPPRIVSFFGGDMKFDAASLPIIGNPDASFILVEFFDYTCRSCREMAGDLKALKQKWPGMFGVVVLPSPLNRNCNPFLRERVPDHPGACELARLSLAVWCKKPEAFAGYHDYLLSLPLPAGDAILATARKRADEIAGAAVIQAALDDPEITTRLNENFGSFARLTSESIVMPKLLVHGKLVLHGPVRDTQAFLSLMEQQFGLGKPGIPVVSPPK